MAVAGVSAWPYLEPTGLGCNESVADVCVTVLGGACDADAAKPHLICGGAFPRCENGSCVALDYCGPHAPSGCDETHYCSELDARFDCKPLGATVGAECAAQNSCDEKRFLYCGASGHCKAGNAIGGSCAGDGGRNGVCPYAGTARRCVRPDDDELRAPEGTWSDVHS